MNQKHYSYIIISLACIILLSACGYKTGNTRTHELRKVGTLAIPLFSNSSFEAGAGDIFTEAARRVFALRGGFKLKQEGSASYILKGHVLSSDSRTEALKNRTGNTRSGVFSQTVAIELRLEDSSGSLIKECRIVDKADALGGEYPTDVAHNRNVALQVLAEDMMQRAYNEIFEGF